MPRGEIIRWSLFSILLMTAVAFWLRFAFCMSILRVAPLPAGDMYGYAQEANIYGSLGLLSSVATLALLAINLRYRARSARKSPS